MIPQVASKILSQDGGSNQVGAAQVVWTKPERERALQTSNPMLSQQYGLEFASLRSASSDASFRRYLRIDGTDPLHAAKACTYIVMDAPPEHESVDSFVQIAQRIEQVGLNAPKVLEQDIEQGFLLLNDLGSQLYLLALQEAEVANQASKVQALMNDAITALVNWQVRMPSNGLPHYDSALLQRELNLFVEWCVGIEFGQTWTPQELSIWTGVSEVLVASALAQAKVVVHRDYMPRNLMIASPNPAILDFQDAVVGPITYDLASLLRDAFYSWQEDQEIDLAVRYWKAAQAASLPVEPDFGEFWRQVEWMGCQRHLKVLGIFCRLKHRDAKPKYSLDLPRFFNYIEKVARRYTILEPLCSLIEPLLSKFSVDDYCQS